jgi:hypothetical protein
MLHTRLRTLAGLAAAIVPGAIVVHLVAEALALGSAAVSPAFFARHLYLGVLLAGAGWWFCSTLGLGSGRFEFARRCALARARLRNVQTGYQVPTLFAASAAFFVLTQLCEGAPIAAGSLVLGVVAGVLGSLLSAVVVFYFGRPVVAAALATVSHTPRVTGARVLSVHHATATVPRRAQSVFSLFVPNRPPPIPSLI